MIPETSQQADPKALNLSRSIALSESSSDGKTPNYNAKGKSGEHGAYQWMPGNFEAAAKKYGLDPNDFSPVNQDKVAYAQVKEYKDKGYQPAEIASLWNSGSPHNWQDHAGVNSQGVSYDTPKYVNRVKDFYQKLSGQQTQGGYNPTPYSSGDIITKPTTPTTDTTQPQEQGLGQQLSQRATDASKALSDTATGKINPLSGILQTVGAGAGAVGDVVNKGLGLIPGVKQIEGAIGQGVSSLANTGVGKGIINSWQGFAQAHPEAAADIGSLGNIATAIPIFKGFSALKEAAGGAISKALGKDALSSVIDDVGEKQTAGAIAKGVAQRGTTKSLITGKISVPTSAQDAELARTVVDNVPGFSKAKTLADKINLTQDTVDTMANDLKNQIIQGGSDRIYSFRELGSYLNNLPKPTLLVGDMEKVYGKVIDKALEIAKQQGGNISSLFDSRKLFDNFISQEFPNLYSSDTLTPMRMAVKNIRQGMNGFIEKNLPDNIDFRNSLRIQSRLLRATENMSKKVASGSMKEIGTTRLQRFGMRHPVIKGLIKRGGSTAIGAAGLGAGYEAYKGITGQ